MGMDNISRRKLVKGLMVLFGLSALPRFGTAMGTGNFTAIYGDPVLRAEFLKFLQVVYNIYPDQKFHKLIIEAVESKTGDQAIYTEIQSRLKEIKPLLSEITYGLPALRTQKKEMAGQMATLLEGVKSMENYIEIGTPGRYVDGIDDRIPIKGKVWLVDERKPGYKPTDLVERGRLRKVGEFVSLNNYAPWTAFKENSADVISCFIGLHHAPADRLDAFVGSIHKTLKPGGKFILRDHDAHSPQMVHMVALAHDVFNAGLKLPWKDNEREIRLFKSLAQIDKYLGERGLERSGPSLYQKDDPTKNALQMYTKKA
jgi:SAM-dependent methyltransferase